MATNSDHITVRIGSHSLPLFFTPLSITSAVDTEAFQRLVAETARVNQGEPIIITANGFNPYLDTIYASCFDFHGSSPAMVNRELQFSDNVQLPQSADRKAATIPWTFIVDHMNLPEVYRWSFGKRLIGGGEHVSSIDHYRFRIAAWVCDQSAYRFDRSVPVIFIFTRDDVISESATTTFLFPHLYRAAMLYDDRTADDAVCWVYHALYNLLSDWQNIITEVGRKLFQAELDNKHLDLPLKTRTRRLHKEVDRMYELHDYLRFHMRSFEKLSKFKTSEAVASKRGDTIWEVMDDSVEDLEQYETYLDSMKERFNNLIELEFNIESASQSADGRFLSILGAVFLPISFLAGIFGFSTVNWPWEYYFYACVPLLIISIALLYLVPRVLAANESRKHPTHLKRIHLHKEDYTLLGSDSPGLPIDDRAERSSSDESLMKYEDRMGVHKRGKSPPRYTHHRDSDISFYGILRSPVVAGSRKRFGSPGRRSEEGTVGPKGVAAPRVRRASTKVAHVDGAGDERDWREVDIEKMGSVRRHGERYRSV